MIVYTSESAANAYTKRIVTIDQLANDILYSPDDARIIEDA
jgi:hypothetical protein